MDFLFTRKNATIAPTTMTEITIPAMPPPPIPDFLPSLLVSLLASCPVVLLPPPVLWCWLLLGTRGVPGGGGGAGPELHALPPVL